MKLKSIILPLFAAVVFLTGCAKKEKEYIDPVLEVPTSLELTQAAGDQTIQIKATRAWRATISYEGTAADWLSVSPETAPASMDKQTLTFTAKENTGRNRIANVKITIGLEDATIVVTQAGPGGSADPVYFNDFDKAAAVQTSSKWPYIYDTDCWRNETGTGIADITYVLTDNKASIRNNSNSSGSGVNNVFFGSGSRFCVKNIALPEGKTNYTVSFYGIRNVYGASTGEGKSVFDSNVFKLYVSSDGEKWVALDYAFEGGAPDAEWGEATSTFTVPSGTKTLCLGVPCPSESSTYRIDDVKLDIAEAAGTAIDFTQGIEISEFKEGTVIDPTKAEAKTVADFISAADQNTYFKLTGTVSGFSSKYCSFDLTDATGSIYVYSVEEASKTQYASIIKDGGTITISGKYAYYDAKSQHEVVSAVILDFKEGQQQDPAKAEAKTVQEFLSIKDPIAYYKLEGTISNFNSSFCSFDLTDATGTINVYSVEDTCKTKYASILQDGFKVTVSGKYKNYQGTEEMVNAVILGYEGSDYLSVDPKTKDVAATAGTTEISVTSDQSWTVSSDNPDFAVSPASGTGNGTVTVTYAANSAFTSRTANITFAVGGTTRATTVITQAAAEDPSAETKELTNDEIKTEVQTGSGYGTGSVTITSTSGEWTGNMNHNASISYIQIRNKQGSFLQTPVFTKDIEKVEFTIAGGLNINTQTGASLSRQIYAIPVGTTLPTSSSTYSGSLYTTNYGYADTSGQANDFTATLTVSGNQKQLLFISKEGANYIKSIKVYFKK